jgi:hypothetical protein
MEVVTIVLLLPGIIWESIVPVASSLLYLNITMAFVIVSCTFLSLIAGFRMLKILRGMQNETAIHQALLLVTRYQKIISHNFS